MLPELITHNLEALGLDPESIAMAQGMLLGDKSGLSPDVLQTFRAAGMSHLLAVSGLHVGIVMALVWLMLRPFEMLVHCIWLAHDMRAYYYMNIIKRLLVIGLATIYVGTIGWPISAVRALLMLGLMQVSWCIRRPGTSWGGLTLAALVLISLDPWVVTEVGFQLSFLAVAGILLCSPWHTDPSWPWWLRLVVLSVSAQVFTVPVVAYTFHLVPVLGWLQGLLVLPLMPVLMAALLLGVASPTWQGLAVPIEALTGWMQGVAQVTTQLEALLLGGHVYLYPTWWEALLAEVALLAFVLFLRLRWPKTNHLSSYN